MGMAASQATLLTLTSRLHDIEYKAQNIQNQKIALATQKDELYQEYCNALDAKKIQVAFNNGDGTKQFMDASFATLCSFNENRCKQYSLKDANTGNIIVDAKTAEIYEDFNTDKYAFAFAMLGMDANFGWNVNNDMGMDVGIGVANDDYGDGTASNGLSNLFMTDVEQEVFKKHQDDEKLQKVWNILKETCNSDSADDSDKQEALDKFRKTLYDSYGPEIYQYMRLNKNEDSNKDPEAPGAEFDDEYPESFPKSEFNYYVRLFEEIEAAGGCQLIDPQYEAGSDGNEWLNNMVNSGRVIIDVYNEDKKEWSETSVATSTNANYLQETQDTTDLKKAETKYEYELGIINRKDTKFDTELSNLETERNAITTEMESVKKVRDENVEKTFGIFG